MKLKWYMLTVMVLMSMVLQSCGTKNIVPHPGKEVVLRLEPGPDNFRNSEGDFITLKDGRILFVYSHFIGGNGDNDSAYLAGRYSDDKGRTWTQTDSLIVANEGGMNVMAVSLLRLHTGEIALFYAIKNSSSDCAPHMRISRDEAETWGPPQKCVTMPGYYTINNDRVIQLENGRIIVPVGWGGHPVTGEKGQIMCYYSDDNGATFNKSKYVPNPQNIVVQEPGIIQLRDGTILLFCRTLIGKQVISYSKDRGESWTPFEESNITSPLSPASMKRVPSTGDLLLVWNNNYEDALDGGKRTPFNLAISSDEGKTWSKIKTLESDPHGWYCYTAIKFLDDSVLLGHCAGNRRASNGLETIQITRLSYDWIYADATAYPRVVKDKNGSIELTCDDVDVMVRYTLDKSIPTLTHGDIYKGPFEVSGTTTLLMQAFASGKTPSQIVHANVGSDVHQEAFKLDADLSPGLFYQYYEGTVSRAEQIETLKLVASGIQSEINLEPSRRKNDFAIVFNGYLDVPQDGQYTFYLESNDGSMLYINDKLLIDNDGGHGKYEVDATVALKKGNHKLQCEYFQMAGALDLQLNWKGPGFDKSEIPAELLFHGE